MLFHRVGKMVSCHRLSLRLAAGNDRWTEALVEGVNDDGLGPGDRLGPLVCGRTPAAANPNMTVFRDPFLQAAFKAAEDDRLASTFVEVQRQPVLSGGAFDRTKVAHPNRD